MIAPKLDERLQTAADLVRPCDTAADIGCDHGKLSAYLACTGRARRVIAADLRPGPLSTAQKTCEEAGCLAHVELRLGDGLSVLAPGEAQAVVIAGVSAQTAIEMLTAAPWVKAEKTQLVLIPATKAPVLRRWLWENGFSLNAERLVCAAHRWYAVMDAVYTGEAKRPTDEECLLGLTQDQPGAAEYRAQQLERLKKFRRGLENDPDGAQRADQLLQQLEGEA